MADRATIRPHPVELRRRGADCLVIKWSDGVEHELMWAELRKNCPCAGCREERANPQPLLPVIKIEDAQAPTPKLMEPVGRYAYQITWSDGHSSGIYTFEFLREIGETEQNGARS